LPDVEMREVSLCGEMVARYLSRSHYGTRPKAVGWL
jgi:hypothetical protein